MFLKLDANILYTIANIIILVLVLKVFLFKPVTKMMEARQKVISDSLQDAEKEKASAQALEKQHATALDGAKQEAAQIMKDAYLRAEKESARLLAQTQAEAAKILENARVQAVAERERVLLDARGQIAGLALLAGAKLVQREIDPGVGTAYIESFLAEAGVKV